MPDAGAPEIDDGPAPAYAGLRVLDLSQGIAGPYCAGLLAGHGADVVKVEPPAGDWVRSLGARHGEFSGLAITGNLGKRGIALDLKAAAGIEAALAIAARAEVVIEAFRPGVADRLGVGYEAVRAVNGDVVYLSISGFGQRGPYRDRAGTDTVGQAFSGIMATNLGADGAPHRVGFPLVDLFTALYAFQALAPVLPTRAGGDRRAHHLDVSLMQAAAATQAHAIVDRAIRGAESAFPLNVPAGTYRTRDGWLAVTLVTERHFPALCEAIGEPGLATDPRYRDFAARGANRTALESLIADRLRADTTEGWCARFAAAGVLHEPVRDHADWLADPHVRAVEAAPGVDQPGIGAIPVPHLPGAPASGAPSRRAAAPAIGEHGAAVLRECGYDAASIDALVESGALWLPARATA